jgi:mono/diheme cytochrome c family protein
MKFAGSMAVVAIAAASALAWTGTVAHDRITTTVTWDREISPIFQARCQSCHGAGAKTTMPLTSYAEARPWARAIKHQVLTRRMPIWHAARGYGDFANDPSLSPFEVALIAAWVDGGAPKALPSTQPNAPEAAPPAVTSPASSAMAPSAVPAGRAFALRCGDQPLMPGLLLGLKPQVPAGGSMKVVLSRPDGRREILGWFRDFNPDFAPTYWLRVPGKIPRGARIIAEATPPCTLTVVMVPGN